MSAEGPKRSGRRRRGGDAAATPKRDVDYHTLKNPFPPATVYSDDHVAALHAQSLRVLSELGMKVLLPEARRFSGKAEPRS